MALNNKINKVLKESLHKLLKESILRDKIFISYGTESFNISKFKPIELNDERIKWWSYMHNKPHGGLWGSPVDCEFGWGDFCNRDGFRLKTLSKHFLFKISSDAKICIIDNKDDLLKYSFFNKRLQQYVLDFLYITSHFDGIFVTENAIKKLKYGDYHERLNGLDSWDVESICIFNPDVIIPVQENAFDKSKHHKYSKPRYNYDDEEYYYGFDNLNDRKQLQIDSDYELYGNQNLGDTSKLFTGEHPGLAAQKHGNNKDAKLARKFNGTVKSGL
jgi:hypothetical protein